MSGKCLLQYISYDRSYSFKVKGMYETYYYSWCCKSRRVWSWYKASKEVFFKCKSNKQQYNGNEICSLIVINVYYEIASFSFKSSFLSFDEMINCLTELWLSSDLPLSPFEIILLDSNGFVCVNWLQTQICKIKYNYILEWKEKDNFGQFKIYFSYWKWQMILLFLNQLLYD